MSFANAKLASDPEVAAIHMELYSLHLEQAASIRDQQVD